MLHWPCHRLLSAPPILRKCLTFPCEHGCSSCFCYCCSCMILCTEDVARAPANLGTQGLTSLNQHTCLNCHRLGTTVVYDSHVIRFRFPEKWALDRSCNTGGLGNEASHGRRCSMEMIHQSQNFLRQNLQSFVPANAKHR